MKKILITGGNKGIGKQISLLAKKLELDVYVLGRDFQDFDIDGVTQIEFDLNNIDKVSQIYKITGDIDILINNAGIMNATPMEEYTEEQKKRIVNVNLEAPIELTKMYLSGMISNGGGRIVNTASIAGEIGHPDIWYGITKAGIINLTKSIAKNYGSKGIVINCVAPGPVDTDMLSTIPEERKDGLKKASINGRFAKPEEVAETIMWLAIESPEFINGICVDINNGTFMR